MLLHRHNYIVRSVLYLQRRHYKENYNRIKLDLFDRKIHLPRFTSLHNSIKKRSDYNKIVACPFGKVSLGYKCPNPYSICIRQAGRHYLMLSPDDLKMCLQSRESKFRIRVCCQSISETLNESRKRTRTFSGLFVRISTLTYCIPYILHVHDSIGVCFSNISAYFARNAEITQESSRKSCSLAGGFVPTRSH